VVRIANEHVIAIPPDYFVASPSTVAQTLAVAVIFLSVLGCSNVDDPLFLPLSVHQSGVDFVNRVEDRPEFNIISYLYFYDGGGVAVGDVNGDGLPDIYLTANQGPNRLYLNHGDLRFEDVTDLAGVAGSADWSTGVTMADVNGDGLLDIYVSVVSGYEDREGYNELFINNGDLTFTESAADYGLDFRGYGTQAAFFDYDLDGDLDAFLLNHSTHGEQTYGPAELRRERHPQAGDRLLRNDDGRFEDVSEEAGIYGGPVGYGLGVAVSDLTANGCPDIYVANDFHENDYFYVNNCDGTFSESIRRATGHNSRSSMGIDAADLNNDGLTDVAVVDMLPDREDVLKTSASVESYEIAQIKLDFGYYHQYTRNTLLLNRGEGRFSDIAYLAGVEATDWSWAALLCDLDNDGWKDLFVSNGIWRRPNDLDYTKAVSSSTMQEALEDISEADLKILEKMPHVPISNYVFRNNRDLTFTDRTEAWGLGQALFSNGAAYADLDNDGDLDLVVNNLNEKASIYENQGRGRNYLTVRLNGPPPNSWGVGAKVILKSGGRSQLQELMPTRGFQSSVDPRLHFGLDTLSIVDSVFVVWPDRRYQLLTKVAANQQVEVHASEADGRFDYARLREPDKPRPVADITDDVSSPYSHMENAFVDFTREPLMPHMVSTEGPALAAGDVNGDGLDDLFVGNAKSRPSALLMQQPSGAFVSSNEAVFRADSQFEDVDAAFFDADGDGDLDLYVVTAGNEWWGDAEALRDRLYINDAGTFYRASDALPDIFQHGSVVRPADFDDDGDVDLFVGGRVVAREYGTAPRSYLLRNEGGRFTDVTAALAAEISQVGMVTDAVWTDIDNDGLHDLVVVGEWMPPRVFRQTDGGFAQIDAGFSGLDGWWTSVAAVDLNEDGRDDLILGNLGLNSRLRASADEPVRLHIADLDADGEKERILTSYRNGVSYPFASRDELLEAFPSLARQFPSYAHYGASQLEDIFPVGRIRAAEVLEARTFASIVAMNTETGTFDVRSLPPEAQFAPVRSILAHDFDHDGNTDILLGGNFYGVQPARGRYDAGYGTYLRGDGRGGLKAVEPGESGLWLEGEIRKLRLIQSANHLMIVAGRNNDSLQFVAFDGLSPGKLHLRAVPSSF